MGDGYVRPGSFVEIYFEPPVLGEPFPTRPADVEFSFSYLGN